MSVGEGFGVVLLELKLEGLDEVGEGGADFAHAAVIACEVVVGGGL